MVIHRYRLIVTFLVVVIIKGTVLTNNESYLHVINFITRKCIRCLSRVCLCMSLSVLFVVKLLNALT